MTGKGKGNGPKKIPLFLYDDKKGIPSAGEAGSNRASVFNNAREQGSVNGASNTMSSAMFKTHRELHPKKKSTQGISKTVFQTPKLGQDNSLSQSLDKNNNQAPQKINNDEDNDSNDQYRLSPLGFNRHNENGAQPPSSNQSARQTVAASTQANAPTLGAPHTATVPRVRVGVYSPRRHQEEHIKTKRGKQVPYRVH